MSCQFSAPLRRRRIAGNDWLTQKDGEFYDQGIHRLPVGFEPYGGIVESLGPGS
jgi:hypothetical protein